MYQTVDGRFISDGFLETAFFILTGLKAENEKTKYQKYLSFCLDYGGLLPIAQEPTLSDLVRAGQIDAAIDIYCRTRHCSLSEAFDIIQSIDASTKKNSFPK